MAVADGADTNAGGNQIEVEAGEQTCNAKHLAPGWTICVCNSNSIDSCGRLQFAWPQSSGTLLRVTTSKSGRRFETTRLDGTRNRYGAKDKGVEASELRINLNDEKQTVLGWGGALTDAALFNINNLSSELSQQVLESYYGRDGLQYNFVRVPIAGTDFSIRKYSYDDIADDSVPDYNLQKWALAPEDTHLKIPYLKRIAQIVVNDGLPEIKHLATPWSPPKWMKDNKSFIRGHLTASEKIYRAYAKYLVKFFLTYREHGIEFWGSTIQNEPIAAFFPHYFFNSLEMGPSEMIDFIGNYLGPELERHNYTKANFKLIVGDDSLGFDNFLVPPVMKDPKVQKYVSGIAFHWYTSGIIPYSFLSTMINEVRDTIEFALMTEACEGSFGANRGVLLGNWDRGANYAADIIQDLLHSAGGWIDWNLALDPSGGPTWADNRVDSPIIVDYKKNEFYKQPMYYTLAHFSRLFTPGSVRVGTDLKSRNLMAVAVHKKDTGHLIVNILNSANSNQKLSVTIAGSKKQFVTVVEPHSLNSLIYKI